MATNVPENRDPNIAIKGIFALKNPTESDKLAAKAAAKVAAERAAALAAKRAAVVADEAEIKRLFRKGIDDKTIVGMKNRVKIEPGQIWQL